MTGLSLIYTSQHAGVAFKYHHHCRKALWAVAKICAKIKRKLRNYWFKFGEIEKLGKNYINKCASDQWPVGETRATKGTKEAIRTEIIKYCFRISDYLIISFFSLTKRLCCKEMVSNRHCRHFCWCYALSRDDKSITCCVLSMIVASNNRRL